jgi:hypothetical protein
MEGTSVRNVSGMVLNTTGLRPTVIQRMSAKLAAMKVSKK